MGVPALRRGTREVPGNHSDDAALRPGPVVESQNNFLVAQKIVLLEVLEAESGSARLSISTMPVFTRISFPPAIATQSAPRHSEVK